MKALEAVLNDFVKKGESLKIEMKVNKPVAVDCYVNCNSTG